MHKINHCLKTMFLAFVLVVPVFAVQPVFAEEKETPVEVTEVEENKEEIEEVVDVTEVEKTEGEDTTEEQPVEEEQEEVGEDVKSDEKVDDMVKITITSTPIGDIDTNTMLLIVSCALLVSAGGLYLVRVRKPKNK